MTGSHLRGQPVGRIRFALVLPRGLQALGQGIAEADAFKSATVEAKAHAVPVEVRATWMGEAWVSYAVAYPDGTVK